MATEVNHRPLDEQAVTSLADALRGQIIEPDAPDYDEARALYSAMIDHHPRLIVRCRDAGDIMASVNFARERGLSLALRGGGHNVAGLGGCDDGLVIDMSLMRGIHVNPAARIARVEPGCTWGDVDHATHAFGLATPTGFISTTGVPGLTLGGGFGYLSRHYGLTIDNLLSADIVTADGRLQTVDKDRDPDLFWAIRGGGGNFGVVTSFEFRLHPVDMIYGGPLFYPVEQAANVLHCYRDYIRRAPLAMNAWCGFLQAPPAPFIPDHLHFAPMVIIVTCYSGNDLRQGEALVRPLREAIQPAVDLAGPMPYPMLNSLFDAAMPAGMHHYWKADYVPELTDAAIAVHTEYGPQVPSPQSTVHLYPQTGAIHQVGRNETAYSHRDAEFVHIVAAIDTDPARMPADMAWMQRYYDALRPSAADGGYVNFLMADEGQARVKATYRDNYDRLVAIKTRYDPGNLFRVNQNIAPAS